MKAWTEEETGRVIVFTTADQEREFFRQAHPIGVHADADVDYNHFVQRARGPKHPNWLGMASIALSVALWIAVIAILLGFVTGQFN